MPDKPQALPFIIPKSVTLMVDEWDREDHPPKYVALAFKTKAGAKHSFRIWSEVCEVQLLTSNMIVMEIEEIW